MSDESNQIDLAAVIEELRANDAFTLKTTHLSARIFELFADYRDGILAEMREDGGFDDLDLAMADAVSPLCNLIVLSAAREVAESYLRASLLEGRSPFGAVPASIANVVFDDLAYVGRHHARIILNQPVYDAIVTAFKAKREHE